MSAKSSPISVHSQRWVWPLARATTAWELQSPTSSGGPSWTSSLVLPSTTLFSPQLPALLYLLAARRYALFLGPTSEVFAVRAPSIRTVLGFRGFHFSWRLLVRDLDVRLCYRERLDSNMYESNFTYATFA